MIEAKFTDEVLADMLKLIGEDKTRVGNVMKRGENELLVRYDSMTITPLLIDGALLGLQIDYYSNGTKIGYTLFKDPILPGTSVTLNNHEGLHSVKISS